MFCIYLEQLCIWITKPYSEDNMIHYQGDRRIISSKSPGSLVTFDDVVAEIKLSLFNLKEIASVTNFYNANEKANYRENMALLCEFYTRGEYLLLKGEGTPTTFPVEEEPGIQPPITEEQRTPLSHQMARWTEKLLENITAYETVKDTMATPEKVQFIRNQYTMLHAGYRVMLGRAVFVGAY